MRRKKKDNNITHTASTGTVREQALILITKYGAASIDKAQERVEMIEHMITDRLRDHKDLLNLPELLYTAKEVRDSIAKVFGQEVSRKPCNKCPCKKNSVKNIGVPNLLGSCEIIRNPSLVFSCREDDDRVCSGSLHIRNNEGLTPPIRRNEVLARKQIDHKGSTYERDCFRSVKDFYDHHNSALGAKKEGA